MFYPIKNRGNTIVTKEAQKEGKPAEEAIERAIIYYSQEFHNCDYLHDVLPHHLHKNTAR